MSRNLIAGCAGIAAVAATAAYAATNLTWVARPDARSAIGVVVVPAVPSVAVAPNLDDLPIPAPPAELAGLPTPTPSSTPTIETSLLAASIAPAGFFTLRSPTGGPSFQSIPDPAPASAASERIREIVRRDTASLDLSRIAVLPPPRPAFIEARPATAMIASIQPDSTAPAWSDVVTLAMPSWQGSLAETPVDDTPPLTGHERTLQAGVASWYGPGFHGRRTASGEVFNQNALTAAHRHLPFGTKVRVIDQKTGRSVIVRINDRGPFSHGRVIDLSKGSAAALGMSGLTRVKIVSAQ